MNLRILTLLLIVVVAISLVEAAPKRKKSKNRDEPANTDTETQPATDDGDEDDDSGPDTAAGSRAKGNKNKDDDDDEEEEDEDDEDETTADPTGKGKGKGQTKKTKKKPGRGKTADFNTPKKVKLTDEDKQKIRGACGKKKNGCKGQDEKFKEKKEKTKNLLKDIRRRVKKQRKGGAELTPEEEDLIEAKTERQLIKIQEAKKAVLKAQGIDENEVDPADTGVWQGDMLLSAGQSEGIIEAQLAGDDSTPPPLPGTLRRSKRFSLFLDEDTGARWDKMPIPVVIDDLFTDAQKAAVMGALTDIELKSCIRFQLMDEAPMESYIYYVKEDYATFCGLSSVGRTGDENWVWLNFDEFCEEQINGTIIHETLHTLGVDHQQSRYDRGNNLEIIYDNIDPQLYDNFATGDTDTFTSFGVAYDWYSIMHYSANVGVVEEGTQSMSAIHDVPKMKQFFTEVMGQRTALSNGDAELLRKMYCMPDCRDKQVYCGWWKSAGYCKSSTEVMLEHCPNACGWCPLAVNDATKQRILKLAAAEAAAPTPEVTDA